MKDTSKRVYLSDVMSSRSENISLLRFFAALLVIFGHSYAISGGMLDPVSKISGDLASCGGISVAIFFFLSGLYVTASLNRKIKSGKDSPLRVSADFMKRRCDRIFPDLIIVVVLSVTVLGPVLTTLPARQYFLNISTFKYLLNAVLIPVHNLPGVFEGHYDSTVNGALWTLPVEFAAYCFLAFTAFCVLTVKKENIGRIMHFAALFISVAAFIYSSIIGNNFLVRVTRPVVCYMAGVLFCDYAKRIVLSKTAALILLAVAAVCCFTPAVNYVLVITLPYIVPALFLGGRQIKSSYIFGKISYQMYLLGCPIQQAAVALSGNKITPLPLFFISAAADIILAVLLYLVTEQIGKLCKKKATA